MGSNKNRVTGLRWVVGRELLMAPRRVGCVYIWSRLGLASIRDAHSAYHFDVRMNGWEEGGMGWAEKWASWEKARA